MNKQTIIAALQQAGALSEQARVSRRSLDRTERAFISEVREAARLMFSEAMIKTIEEEGAGILRRFI